MPPLPPAPTPMPCAVTGTGDPTALPRSTDASDERLRLGAAIRRLRKRRGLTLVELAAEAQLSHSFLSQLERALAWPSMASLHRIAQALGTTQQALMVLTSVHPEPATVDLVRSGEGLRVAAPGGGARMLARGAHPLHSLEFNGAPLTFDEYYTHGGSEFLYVVHGEIEVDIQMPGDPQVLRLGPGDSLCYPGTTPHRLRAIDTTDVRVLMVQNASSPDIGMAAGEHGGL